MRRPQQMSTHSEEILHHAVDRHEAFHVRGRLKAAHLALALSNRLVRDLGAAVRVLIRAVDHRRHHHALRGRVTAELVGDQPARDTGLAFQSLPEESDRGALISPRLHQDIEDVTVLVHGPPEILQPAGERHEEFVEMPRVPQPAASAPESASVARTERKAPLADGLVGDRDAPLGQQVLDIPEAQSESVREPHGVADDLRRETITVVAR